MTYTQLINQTLELYLKQEYQEAYNFITENSSKVKGNRAQIYNFRYAIASKAGMTDLAIEIMREAIINQGYWYSHQYLIEDEDLLPLQEYNDFAEFVNICKTREIQAQKGSKPDIKVILPPVYNQKEKHSLIMALHGNQENILITEDYWGSSVTATRLLALPQSSQIDFSDAYNWTDLTKGITELRDHYYQLIKRYNLEPEDFILGGFSAGARLALYGVLKGIVQARGLILIGPWLPEFADWQDLFYRLKGVKIYIICGDQDEDCFEDSREFVKALNERGITNTFKIVKGLKHDYPEKFSEELQLVLKEME